MAARYTDADAIRDCRALDAALRPVVDEALAWLGITREEARALIAAGLPPPPPPVISPPHPTPHPASAPEEARVRAA